MLVPYLDRPYRYRIETSTDNATWTIAVDRTANTAAGTRLDNLIPGTGDRPVVRLTVTGVYGTSTTWASIIEFGVYDRVFPTLDLARGRPTTATSAQSGAGASQATDGDLTTCPWSSTAAPTTARPQNLTVQLINTIPVDTVTWFSRSGSGPRTVNITVSTDGTAFTTVAALSVGNSEGPWTTLFPAVSARYVRLAITGSYSASTVSVEQLEVFRLGS